MKRILKNQLQVITDNILTLETIANIGFAVLINVILISRLGLVEYGKYSVNIALTILLSATNLGATQLIPNWIMKKEIDGKIFNLIIAQILITLFFGIAILYVTYNIAPMSKTSVLSKQTFYIIFNCIALYVDDIIHTRWRIGKFATLSAVISVIVKIIIIIYTALIIPKSGEEAFRLITTLIVIFSMVKIIALTITDNKSSRPRLSKIQQVVRDSYAVWLSNLSNSLFNGMGRVILGNAYGPIILGHLTLVSQITGAVQAIISSFVISKIKEEYEKSTRMALNAYKKIKKQTLITFLLLFFSNFIFGIYHLNNLQSVNLTFYSEIYILGIVLAITIITSMPMSVVPEFVIAQFEGKQSSIAKANLLFATAGVLLMLLAGNFENFSIYVVYIMAAVTFASITFTRIHVKRILSDDLNKPNY
jgi:O-antigen/teichoic acid export membrane protein